MKKLILADLAAAVLPSLVIIAVAVYAVLLQSLNADLYYLSIQEDEYIEWATFWAFIGAGLLYLRIALRLSGLPGSAWCHLCLVGFCLFIAMEEISWGQRVFGYRPPEYFLEFNYQQELNIHNVVDTDLRKLAVKIVIFGYGVALPLLALLPAFGAAMQRIHLVIPPITLVPAFAATGILLIVYPFKFTGEWVELMLGMCFAFSAISLTVYSERASASRPGRPLRIMLLMTLMIGVVGIASAAATRYQRDNDRQNVVAANQELAALSGDVEHSSTRLRCGLHKRLYTVATQYRAPQLLSGQFAQLTEQGLPEERAAYLLDPWNYAYWLRDNCATSARPHTTYLYSFGPNRRRDSTKWAIGGDDIAIFVRGSDQQPGD